MVKCIECKKEIEEFGIFMELCSKCIICSKCMKNMESIIDKTNCFECRMKYSKKSD